VENIEDIEPSELIIKSKHRSGIHDRCSSLQSWSAEMNGIYMNAFEKLQAQLLSRRIPSKAESSWSSMVRPQVKSL
jgi:hypothetical protein